MTIQNILLGYGGAKPPTSYQAVGTGGVSWNCYPGLVSGHSVTPSKYRGYTITAIEARNQSSASRFHLYLDGSIPQLVVTDPSFLFGIESLNTGKVLTRDHISFRGVIRSSNDLYWYFDWSINTSSASLFDTSTVQNFRILS